MKLLHTPWIKPIVSEISDINGQTNQTKIRETLAFNMNPNAKTFTPLSKISTLIYSEDLTIPWGITVAPANVVLPTVSKTTEGVNFSYNDHINISENTEIKAYGFQMFMFYVSGFFDHVVTINNS